MANQFTVDPLRQPPPRMRSPREPNGYRGRPRYRVYHFFLPIGLYEALRLFILSLEHQETRRFGKKHLPRTKNFHVAEALRAYLKYHGMSDPGLLEAESEGRR